MAEARRTNTSKATTIFEVRGKDFRNGYLAWTTITREEKVTGVKR